MRGVLQLPFFFSREWRPGAVPDVEDAYKMFPFVQRVDNSVGAWFLPKKQMAKFLAFPNDCTALPKSLQTVNSTGQIIDPCNGVFVGFGINDFVDALHVSQCAVGQPIEVWHG